MRVTLMLCDHAEVADGKLFINGGGWSITGPQQMPSAIALLVHVPWDRTNTRIGFGLRLLTEDGQAVNQMTPNGPAPVEIGGEFEVGRPAGTTPGTELVVPLAVNVGPLPLEPGRRYTWQLALDGEAHDDWRLSFATR